MKQVNYGDSAKCPTELREKIADGSIDTQPPEDPIFYGGNLDAMLNSINRFACFLGEFSYGKGEIDYAEMIKRIKEERQCLHFYPYKGNEHKSEEACIKQQERKRENKKSTISFWLSVAAIVVSDFNDVGF